MSSAFPDDDPGEEGQRKGAPETGGWGDVGLGNGVGVGVGVGVDKGVGLENAGKPERKEDEMGGGKCL